MKAESGSQGERAREREKEREKERACERESERARARESARERERETERDLESRARLPRHIAVGKRDRRFRLSVNEGRGLTYEGVRGCVTRVH